MDTGDLNRDGFVDIVVGDRTLNTVFGFDNHLTDLTSGFVGRVLDDTGVDVRDVVIADVDLDGDADVLSAASGSNILNLILNVCCDA